MSRLNRRIFFEFFCLDGNYSPKNEQIYERVFLTVRKEVIEIKEKNHVMTYSQSRRARKLVHQCCNYESRNSLPLTMEKQACVQSISYSLLYNWFCPAVLPLDESLATALLHRKEPKRCAVCDQLFLTGSNRAKYCKVRAFIVRRQLWISEPRFFVDDGFSGTSFQRPGFQEMMRYVEDYSVSAVIVKDLSWLGWEYSYMVWLQDFIFPTYDVRFIAINDDVDSAKGENDFAVFKNVFNDYYAKDTSKKIRAVVKMRGEAGEHLASNSPYGYIKDPQDKKKWIVDEEAAKVVQRIFNLCIAGKGPMQIAKILTTDRVLIVTAYHARQNGWAMPENLYQWCAKSVAGILERREYTGCTVNFKTYTKSLKFKNRMENSVENQQVFEDTQPAIIDSGQWEWVQELRKNKRRPTKTGRTSMFSGLLYCADCGAKLYFCTCNTYKDDSQNHFVCSNYKSNTGYCQIHYIQEQMLYRIVMETIRQTLSYVRMFRKDFKLEMLAQGEESRKAELVEKRKALSGAKKRMEDLDRIIQHIYEDNVLGKLSDSQYLKLSR